MPILFMHVKMEKYFEQGTHKELLDKGGYYAGLVRSQLAQDEIKTKNHQEEILKENTSIKKRNTEEEVHFEHRDKEISLKEVEIPIRVCNIFREISDNKLDLTLACLGAIILGCLSPINGLIIAKAINALNSKYQTVRCDDGLKYAFIFLATSVLEGLGNCLMLWKFLSLGQKLARNYRIKLLKKYLSMHLSFFDVNENSPGSLLTKMSIDTMELNQMLNSILGTIVQCSAVIIVSLIIGCYYEYRLTLINFCFVPFIVMANIMKTG